MLWIGLSLGFKLKKAYLYDFVIELVYLPIEFIVFYFIYSTLFSSTGIVGGYSFKSLLLYVFTSFLLRRIYPTGVRGVVERDIHDGGLVKYLVRPFGYLSLLYGRYMAVYATLLPFTVVVITVFSILLWGTAPSVVSILYFTIASLIGFTVTFELYAITGLISLWLGRHHWFGNLLTLATLVFGGGYLPITFFPRIVADLLKYLPLQAVYNFPSSIISRNMLELDYLVSSTLWLIILLLVMVYLERRGLKRFEAVGG